MRSDRGTESTAREHLRGGTVTTAPGLSLTAPFCPLRPQCVPSGQHTPSETFKIADNHPEVEERVEPLSPSRSPLFHNKHRYQKIGVHEVAAADGQRYNEIGRAHV